MLSNVLPNASSLELTWSAVAGFGLLLALFFEAAVLRSLWAVEEWILQGRARRWGPRHKFVLGFMLGGGLLAVIWAGFIGLGINAMISPPPIVAETAAAAERGGWILTGLEAVLLAFQGALYYAWVAVGGPSIKPNPVAKVRPS